MGVYFKAGCKPIEVAPASPKGYTIDEVSQYVHGKFEEYVITDGFRTIFVNKYAHLFGMSVNASATAYVKQVGGYLQDGDYIAGDALVIKNDEINF